MRIKIPRQCWGGRRGNPDDRPPPPFRESVVEPISAGDLTCSGDNRIFDYRSSNSQLRDSVGVTPTSPLADLFTACHTTN